jgi:hypothetical protein
MGAVLIAVFSASTSIQHDTSSQASPDSAASTNSQPDSSSKQATRGTADKSQSAQQPAAQLTDAKYLSDRYGLLADTACADGADDYLRSVAKYDYAWDHVGILETKFDDYSLIVKKPGVLTVVSDKAKLQNGFGAFEHVKLFCDFDTQADYARDPGKTVLGYSIDLPDN